MITDQAPRPVTLADYVGQPEISAALRRAITAARTGGRQLGHLLFAGSSGCGKTTISQIVAAELGAQLVATTGPAIEHRGALAALLTSLPAGAVLFIDEIHGLNRKLQEILYSAMEDSVVDLQAGKRVIRMKIAPFTLVAATMRAALLTAPLRDRFAYTFQLRPYAADAIAEIVRRAAAPLGLVIEPTACAEIARRSRGVPRVALRLLRAARDFAASAGCGPFVSATCAAAALDAIGVDEIGLECADRAYLTIVARAADAIGLDAIAAELGEEPRAIEEIVEPFLLAAGLVRRTKAGRVVTAAGVAHLQPKPAAWAPRDRQLAVCIGEKLPGTDIEDAEVLS